MNMVGCCVAGRDVVEKLFPVEQFFGCKPDVGSEREGATCGKPCSEQCKTLRNRTGVGAREGHAEDFQRRACRVWQLQNCCSRKQEI